MPEQPQTSDFFATASFFEAKARRAKSVERRQEFSEAAIFYQSLYRITPSFPRGYKQPGPVKPNGSPRKDRLHKRAEECRAMAAAMRDEACRQALTRLAETYEQTAASRW